MKVMSKRKKYIKPVEVGDLVNHVLMDEEWLGVVLEIEVTETERGTKCRALVYLTSDHEFARVSREMANTPQRGWVDVDWLVTKSRTKENEN